MDLAPWLRGFASELKPASKNGNPQSLFLDEQRFRLEIARERMRTDRNGSPLAILMLELAADRATPADLQFLARVLQRRLRLTDAVGLLSKRRVGVLLPDTTKKGAWKLASDVCDAYPLGKGRPDCEVYVYPSDRHEEPSTNGHAETNGFGPVTQREDQRVAGAVSPEVEQLFECRMPAWKRAIDLLGASLGLVLMAPLFLLVALAIKLTSRGPVFYMQEREGLGGRRFRIMKFRTMRMDADRFQASLRRYSEQDGPAFKMSRDPRTTWIGRWLRRTSLDELPQLWNVLRGEMSLVGPRPLPTSESLQCTPWQRQRLRVTPGLTCIWQSCGQKTVSFDDWMRMDLQYVRRRSLGFDLRLLLMTAPSIVLNRRQR